MNQVWQATELSFIKDNASTMKDQELAAKLGAMTGRTVSVQSVRKQRQKLGIEKARGRGVCKVVDKATDSASASVAVAVPVAQVQPENPLTV